MNTTVQKYMPGVIAVLLVAVIVMLMRNTASGTNGRDTKRRGLLEVDIIDYGRRLGPGEKGLSQRG